MQGLHVSSPSPAEGKLSRRMAGESPSIADLPLDVVLEILSNLNPLDLLYVSQSCKTLHSLLYAPSHRGVWLRAFQLIDNPPPPCPPSLSAYRYADLLWASHCHGCANPIQALGCRVHWGTRMRVCEECEKELFVRGPQPRVGGTASNDSSDEMEPSNIGRYQGQQFDYSLALQGQLEYYSGYPYSLYLTADIERVISELNRLKDDEEKLREYKASRRALVARRAEGWSGFSTAWKASRQSLRFATHSYLRENIEKLEAVLVSEGYEDDITPLSSLGWTRTLHPRDIISHLIGSFQSCCAAEGAQFSHVWSLLREDFLYHLERTQQIDLQQHLTRHLTSRMKSVDRMARTRPKEPMDGILPTIAALVRCDPLKTIVKETPMNEVLPSSVTNPDELVVTLEETKKSWMQQTDNFLRDMITGSSGGGRSSVDHDPLSLAKTLFNCVACKEVLQYPRVLVHRCLWNPARVDMAKVEERQTPFDKSLKLNDYDYNMSVIWTTMADWYGPTWNETEDMVIFDERTSTCAEVIIRRLGKDPSTATPSELEDLNARVECRQCRQDNKKKKKLVMNWRTAIAHWVDKHSDNTPSASDWVLLGARDRKKALEAEAAHAPNTRWQAPYVTCIICRRDITADTLKNHFRFKHSRTQVPTFPSRDIPLKRPPFAIRI